MAYKPDSVPIF